MKLAVLSDIHANYRALEAVLRDAAAAGAEAYLVLGDHVTDGPYPRRTLERLYALEREAPTFLLRGNREEYMLDHRAGKGGSWLPGTESGSLHYTYSQLLPADLDRFAGWSSVLPVDLGNGARLLAVHGSPENSRERLLPFDGATHRYLEACPYPALLCGHSHQAFLYPYQGTLLANPGSVGLSAMGSPEARYALMTYEAGYWQCSLRAVPYDVEALVEDIRQCGLDQSAAVWTRCVVATLRTGINQIIPTGNLAYKLAQERGTGGTWMDIPQACWEEAARRLQVPPIGP